MKPQYITGIKMNENNIYVYIYIYSKVEFDFKSDNIHGATVTVQSFVLSTAGQGSIPEHY